MTQLLVEDEGTQNTQTRTASRVASHSQLLDLFEQDRFSDEGMCQETGFTCGDINTDTKNTKENNSQDKTNPSHVSTKVPHIIVIGNTGVGKSSLVKLLTNNKNIKIADTYDTESCTITTTGYQFDLGGGALECDEVGRIYTKRGQLAYIYDTKGLQDIEKKCDDEDNINHDITVLNDIQRRIYTKRECMIKFIWIVKYAHKASIYLNNQAEFISEFENDHDHECACKNIGHDKAD